MEFTCTNYTDRVGNSFLRVRMKHADGRETMRTFTVAQFCHVLGNSLVQEDVPLNKVKNDFWPENTIEAFFGDYENYSCIWRVKGAKRVLVYGGKHYHIPFPDLIFKIKVKKGSIVDKMCFAVKENDEVGLYQYPFGNVSSAGYICTGNIHMKEISEYVESFSEEFFLGITNNDYYGDGSGRVNPKCSQEKLLQKLEKLDTFPEKWLVKKDVVLNDIMTKGTKVA